MNRQDKWIIAVTLVVMISVVVWQAIRDSGEESRNPMLPPMSSISALPQGSKAVYLTLSESGREPIRWGRSFAQLRGRKGTLVTYGVDGLDEAFSLDIDQGELDAVREWVNAGNTVVAFGSHASAIFKDLKPKRSDAAGKGHAQLDGLKFQGFKSVFARTTRDDVVVVSTKDGAFGIERKVGKGRAVLFADSAVMSNGVIGLGDNAAILSMVSRGETIFLDDFHRGHVTSGSALEMLPNQLRSALIIALLVGVLLIAKNSFRFGPIEEEPTRQVRSGAEIAWSLSRLLKQADAVPTAARELVRSFKTETGIPHDDPLETALNRLTAEPDGLRAKLRELEVAIYEDKMQSTTLTVLASTLAETRIVLRDESRGRYTN